MFQITFSISSLIPFRLPRFPIFLSCCDETCVQGEDRSVRQGWGRLLQCTTVLTDVCFTGFRVFPQANNVRTVLLHGCFHTAVFWPWTLAPKVPHWPLQGRHAEVGGLLPASSLLIPSQRARPLSHSAPPLHSWRHTLKFIKEGSFSYSLLGFALAGIPLFLRSHITSLCSNPFVPSSLLPAITLPLYRSRSWVVLGGVLRTSLPLPLLSSVL